MRSSDSAFQVQKRPKIDQSTQTDSVSREKPTSLSDQAQIGSQLKHNPSLQCVIPELVQQILLQCNTETIGCHFSPIVARNQAIMQAVNHIFEEISETKLHMFQGGPMETSFQESTEILLRNLANMIKQQSESYHSNLGLSNELQQLAMESVKDKVFQIVQIKSTNANDYRSHLTKQYWTVFWCALVFHTFDSPTNWNILFFDCLLL